MKKKNLVTALAVILLLTGCNQTTTSETLETQQRIQRIENGLPAMTAIGLLVGEERPLSDRMEFYRVPGVSIAVINDFEIEWAKGYGVLELGTESPVTEKTIFQVSSISKPVTALAAMHFVQEEILDLDQDVNDRLVSWRVPESEFTSQEKVTLRRLLSHTAGINEKALIGYVQGEEIPTLREILDGSPPAHSPAWRVQDVPGSIWRYSNGGYVIVTQLLEDVVGTSFPEIMQEVVFEPLGMESSTYRFPLPDEYVLRTASAHGEWGQPIFGRWLTYPEMGPSGLWSTPTDLARLVSEFMLSLSGRSDRVISQDIANLMLTSHTEEIPYEGFSFMNPLYADWGLGWQLITLGKNFYFVHGGDDPQGFQSLLIALPERGWGAVIMTNGAAGGGLCLEILYTIAEAYGILPPIRTVVFAAYVFILLLALLVVWLLAYLVTRLISLRSGSGTMQRFREIKRKYRVVFLLLIPVTAIIVAVPFYIGLEVAIHSMPGFPLTSHIQPEALGMVEQGELFARHGMIEEAFHAYSEAQVIDARLQISPESWNVICWYGSLWGYAAQVMDACERAVSMAPGNAVFADSRGLALALTGDYAGAIKDFTRYADWLEGQEGYTYERDLRYLWISELSAGRNPFDETTLDQLR